MRFVEKIFDRIASGRLIGAEGTPNGRVTVEPGWMLRATSPVYANSLRGPYRYYLDNERVEYEVPTIQSIKISRSKNQDFATCQITMLNAWHEANTSAPELAGQLGKPGYFWPKRGDVNDASATWNQSPSLGAYKHYPPGHPDAAEEGDWDPTFTWRNVLVEDALIRTYQGYGGKPTDGGYVSIQENIDNEHVVMTGVWLVDTVIGNSSGMLIINCRDVGRLLLDQIVFPPTIPSALYPLEYVPPGRSRFDSMFGSAVSSAPNSAYGSRGPVRIAPITASSAGTTDDYVLDNPIAASVDGNIQDFALTEAFQYSIDGPNNTSTAWFEYDLLDSEIISSVAMTPWAGGYKVFVSAYITGDVMAEEANGWLDVEHRDDEPLLVPATNPSDQIPYVAQIYIPETNPGGSGVGEAEVYAELRRKLSTAEAGYLALMANDDPDRQKLYGLRPDDPDPAAGDLVQLRDISKIRISIQRFYYSGMPDGDGNQYRAGLRTVKAFCLGQNLTPYEEDARTVPWTWDIIPHPTRGYWVLENGGTVHGFGDSADYDGDTLGHLDVAGNPIVTAIYGAQGQELAPSESLTPRAHGITATPSGKGYWGVDWCGKVYTHGDATFYGQHTLLDRDAGHFQNGWPGRLADWRAGQSLTYRNRTPFGYTDTSGNYVAQPATGTPPTRYCIDIAATFTGEGYWVLYSDGSVVAFGDAIDAMPPSSTSFNANGNPATPAKIYGPPTSSTMTAFRNIMNKYFSYGRVSYGYTNDTNLSGKATAIIAHPFKMGFWVANQCGEVAAYGEAAHYGGFENRTYRYAPEFAFDMKLFDYPTSIVSTDTGEGYWILCNSGMVAPFGDAVKKGPIELDSVNKMFEQNIVVGSDRYGTDYFRKLFYGMAKDQDGRGYWLLRADGEVLFYESTDWGNPGWTGLTGYRWHEGNFTGDYASIVKEVAMWAGFTYYESSKDGGSIVSSPTEGYTSLGVLGALESTAIEADIEIQGDKWDKKFIIDIINELSEVVGYSVYVDQEGGFRFESPNWWRTGNFDYDRNRIWGTYDVDHNFTRVLYLSDALALEAGADPFIPEVHEEADMMSYSATISNTDKKWQIIIGTDTPDPRDISRTAHVQHFPPFANDEVSPGVPSLRNIPRTSIWTSHVFENAEERQLMAEMIGIHNYFAARTGTTTAVANPCLDLDDQVRLVERNTSETYIHRIIGIETDMDLDSGTYTMNLQTHWLGTEDNWVLVTTADGAPWDSEETYGLGARVSYSGTTYISTIADNTTTPPGGSGEWVEQTSIDNPLVVISDRLDSWQRHTGRELQLSGYATPNPYTADGTGAFESNVYMYDSNSGPEWGLWYTGTGDMSSNETLFPNVAYKSLGEGLLWPYQQDPVVAYADDGETYAAAKLAAVDQNFILTLGETPEHLKSYSDPIYLDPVAITTSEDLPIEYASVPLAEANLTPTFSASFPESTSPGDYSGMVWYFDETKTVGDLNYEICGLMIKDLVVNLGVEFSNAMFSVGCTDGRGSARPGSATVIDPNYIDSFWNAPTNVAAAYITSGVDVNGTVGPCDIYIEFDMTVVNDTWPNALVVMTLPTDVDAVLAESFSIGSVEAMYAEVEAVPITAAGEDLAEYFVLAGSLDTWSPVTGDITPPGIDVEFPVFTEGVVEGSGIGWVTPTVLERPDPGYILRGIKYNDVQVTAEGIQTNTLLGFGAPDWAGNAQPGSGRAIMPTAGFVIPPPTGWASQMGEYWNSSDTYYPGMLVLYDNITYLCVVENTNSAPYIGSPDWDDNIAQCAVYTLGSNEDDDIFDIITYFDSLTVPDGFPSMAGFQSLALMPGALAPPDRVQIADMSWLWYLPRDMKFDEQPTANIAISGTGPRDYNTEYTYDPSGSSAGVTGEIVSYTWDFGDGSPRQTFNTTDPADAIVTHTFGSNGVWPITLIVEEEHGTRDIAIQTTSFTGQPNASGASSFHVWWDGSYLTDTYEEASVVLRVLDNPPNMDLYFWALQLSFGDGADELSGAHVGLQWNANYPSYNAVNWGGYTSDATPSELEGEAYMASTYETVDSLTNTFDYIWSRNTDYLLRVFKVASEGGDPVGTTRWRATITDIESATPTETVIRDVFGYGDQIHGITMWTEMFAECSEPRVSVEWKDMECLVEGTSAVVNPNHFIITYQEIASGGCHNTNTSLSGAVFTQSSGSERTGIAHNGTASF